MQNQLRTLALMAIMLVGVNLQAQDQSEDHNTNHVESFFKGGRKGSGGYGAITNKFTYINGEFANLAGVYGGWYVDHSLLIGFEAVGLTNDIRVPLEHRVDPFKDLSYMYGQFGMMTEYVVASNKKIHVAFNLFAGAGFTMQYLRHDWHDDHEWDWEQENDDDWFFVAEPGVQVELNVFKWMRFSPGVSYRAVLNSNGRGFSDSSLSDISYNATLKFGKF